MNEDQRARNLVSAFREEVNYDMSEDAARAVLAYLDLAWRKLPLGHPARVGIADAAFAMKDTTGLPHERPED